MLSNNNFWKFENKKNRFSIRKLTVGVTSVLLGFSFAAANGQAVKADSLATNSQNENNTSNSSQKKINTSDSIKNTKTDTDVKTYSGLNNFLSKDVTGVQERGTVNNEDKTGLTNAANDLKTAIDKGNDFVTSDAFKSVAENKQASVNDSINNGKVILDKYNKYVSTNDDSVKVSLFDLTNAKTTIYAMMTAAVNAVGTQQELSPYGGWKLNLTNDGVLTIKAGSDGNTNGAENLSDFLGSENSNKVKKIVIDGNVTLKNQATNNYGVFSKLPNLTTITGLENIRLSVGTTLRGLFRDDGALGSLDLSKFTSESSRVADMSYMFEGTVKLKNLDLQGTFSMANLSTATNMFKGTGRDVNEFTLKLNGTKIPNNSGNNSGLGNGSKYIKVTPYHNSDNPQGVFVDNDTAGKTGQEKIGDLLDYLADGTDGPTTLTLRSQSEDSIYYKVSTDNPWTVDLHVSQASANAFQSIQDKTFEFGENNNNKISVAKLKEAGIITNISWVGNKKLKNRPGNDEENAGYKIDDIEDIDPDNAGTAMIYDDGSTSDLWAADSITDDNNKPKGLIKIEFKDGSYKYVGVTFSVKGAEWINDGTNIPSQQHGTVSLVTQIKPDDPNNSLLSKAILSYVDISKVSNKIDYITVCGTTASDSDADQDNEDDFALNTDWGEISNSDSDGVKTENAKINVYYKNNYFAAGEAGEPQKIYGQVRIASMNRISNENNTLNFEPLQCYQYEDADDVLTAINAELSDKDPNALNARWNGTKPALTTVGVVTKEIKVTFKDGSSGTRNILVNIVANHGESDAEKIVQAITQGKQKDIEIQVPQYTDLTNDHDFAAGVAADNTSFPKGTTFSWDQTKLPDTSKKGTKATAFILVTAKNGSVANIPVNVTIGSPKIQNIELKHNAYLYNNDGNRANGISLKAGSIITIYGTKFINGRKFYLTKDAAFYVAAGNNKPISRKLEKNSYTYNGKGKKVMAAKKFIGEDIKTYGIPVTIKGKEYYAIGHKRYMRKNNFPPTPEWTVPKMSKQDIGAGVVEKKLRKNSFIYTDKLNRANEVILSAGSIIKTYGTKLITGKQYYSLGNDMYVDARNVK